MVKMLTHCQSGVEKGLRKGGNPIEVMGLMLGRPDPNTPHTLVVTDVFPLPIEGFETRVIADDVDVVNHMIALNESIERTRQEKFMGWYHSHPFDYVPGSTTSHCFLSQTDISTQLQWQRAEDPHGNPFLAIVLDPLRTSALNVPQLKAFRAYPPEYQSPVANQCPDGSVVHDESKRLEQWGSCWNRYYELKIEYFMSQHARHVMNLLTKNFLWMKDLSSSDHLMMEEKVKTVERMESMVDQMKSGNGMLETAVISSMQSKRSSAASSQNIFIGGASSSSKEGGGGDGSSSSSSGGGKKNNEPVGGEVQKACLGIVELAKDKVHSSITQTTKKEIFS
jgi:COP9 signalosome complex subunit 5